jgi:hypothetical protein
MPGQDVRRRYVRLAEQRMQVSGRPIPVHPTVGRITPASTSSVIDADPGVARYGRRDPTHHR